jgi:hypothetical protein
MAQRDATIIGGIGEARRACQAAAARPVLGNPLESELFVEPLVIRDGHVQPPTALDSVSS